MAGYEAVIATRNALLPLSSRADYRVVPWTTFTAPELARVGLTEAEARRESDAVTVLRSRFADVDRARCEGEPDGFVKLVAIRGRLVGAHIVGRHAGELIHPCVLALHQRLPVSALASMTWVYPTLSEGVRKAAQTSYDELLARPMVRRAVGVLRRLKGGD
jgi:pyruvate/2-oxoglutarate dehydrogenase complex dihydrolipoamide dehydrogenase (E3) component